MVALRESETKQEGSPTRTLQFTYQLHRSVDYTSLCIPWSPSDIRKDTVQLMINHHDTRSPPLQTHRAYCASIVPAGSGSQTSWQTGSSRWGWRKSHPAPRHEALRHPPGTWALPAVLQISGIYSLSGIKVASFQHRPHHQKCPVGDVLLAPAQTYSTCLSSCWSSSRLTNINLSSLHVNINHWMASKADSERKRGSCDICVDWF